MQDRRNLAWRLNWYRQSELEGALLLGRLVRQAREAYLVQQLTKHCADEARHSWLWDRTIADSVCRRAHPSQLPELLPRRDQSAARHDRDARAHTHLRATRPHPVHGGTRPAGTPGGGAPDLQHVLRDEAAHLD